MPWPRLHDRAARQCQPPPGALCQRDAIDLIWRHGDRETDAVGIVVFLDDAGQQTAATDPVAAHDDGLVGAIPIEIHATEGLGIARPQLENVANFYAS